MILRYERIFLTGIFNDINHFQTNNEPSPTLVPNTLAILIWILLTIMERRINLEYF